MHEMILCKLGEVVLKGLNRRSFEDKLMSNVSRRVAKCGSFRIYSKQSTIYVEPVNDESDLTAAYAACKQVFGVIAVSRALSDMAQNGKRAKLDVVIPFHLIHPCKISVLRYWMASAR